MNTFYNILFAQISASPSIFQSLACFYKMFSPRDSRLFPYCIVLISFCTSAAALKLLFPNCLRIFPTWRTGGLAFGCFLCTFAVASTVLTVSICPRPKLYESSLGSSIGISIWVLLASFPFVSFCYYMCFFFDFLLRMLFCGLTFTHQWYHLCLLCRAFVGQSFETC